MRSNADRVVQALTESGSMSARELVEHTGIDLSNIYKALTHARNDRRVYTSGWMQQAQHEDSVKSFVTVAVFSAGAGVDAPKPPSWTRTHRKRSAAKPTISVPAVNNDAFLREAPRRRAVMSAIRTIRKNDPDNPFACMLGQMEVV